MKTVLASILALVILLPLMVILLFADGGREHCPIGSSGGGSDSADGGNLVPHGDFSPPMAEGTFESTSPFGIRNGVLHAGQDLADRPIGSQQPIYAFADGTVTHAGPASGFGLWIIIRHNVGGQVFSSLYGHMNDGNVFVAPGDQVKAGQRIGRSGWNGGVDPAGPGGNHLHFEIHPGGYGEGSGPVDPIPWLDKARSGATNEPSPSSTPTDKPAGPNTPAAGGALPASIGPVDKLQPAALRLAHEVHARFPEATTIYGWRANGGAANDHVVGRAIDVMIDDYTTTAGIALGDRIKQWVLDNAVELQVDYTIWRQHIDFPAMEGYQMEDRGSETENHYDHVHVSTIDGAGASGGSLTDSPAPGGGDFGCGDSFSGPSTLNGEEIPENYRKWIDLAGHICPLNTPAIQAGILYQESGFRSGLVSTSGALGPAQFMPGTWASVGAKVDDQGQVTGPPGSGDINDPADAIMASGRYLCQIAEIQKPWIDSGEVRGDPTELMIAGYNAGPYAIRAAGGLPSNDETTPYVPAVLAHAERFSK